MNAITYMPYAPRLAEPSVGPENFALGSSSEI